MPDKTNIPVTIIIGATASGKSRLAIELAQLVDGEIISADSMQVYRDMDIGTAKASLEERDLVPHHLIDVSPPTESFHVNRFLELADKAAEDIYRRGKKVIVAGGTPLYVKRFVEGIFEGPPRDDEFRKKKWEEVRHHGKLHLYHQLGKVDPTAAFKIHPNNVRRVIRALEVYHLTGTAISRSWEEEGQKREGYRFTQVGLAWPRQVLYERIETRVDEMLAARWRDEAAKLDELDLSREARQALGYRELWEEMDHGVPWDRTVELIKRNTRRYAKRQLSWFRQFPDVHWFDLEGEVNWKDLARQVDQLANR